MKTWFIEMTVHVHSRLKCDSGTNVLDSGGPAGASTTAAAL